jgi:hypothetical protein
MRARCSHPKVVTTKIGNWSITTGSCKAARNAGMLANLRITKAVGFCRTTEIRKTWSKEHIACPRKLVMLKEQSAWGSKPFYAVLDSLKDNRHILVHCSAGITRSVLVTACVLRALGAQINPEIEGAVQKYQKAARIPLDIDVKLRNRIQSLKLQSQS